MRHVTSIALLLAGTLAVGLGCSHDERNGASASAQPAAGQNTLYHRLGGEDTIRQVVHRFVQKSAKNPKVNLVRNGHPNEWEPSPTNVARFEQRLVEFISEETGGPRKYKGRDMVAAHTDMRITSVEFDAMAGELAATLDEFGVAQKEKDELLSIVGETKRDIVGK